MSEEQMSYTELGIHAAKSAHDYLNYAISHIESLMGKGAAEKYPQIVAAMIEASSREYHASMLSHRVVPALDRIADAIVCRSE